MQRTRISNKILKIFLVQLSLISFAAIVGVLATALIAEEFLVKRALEGEANFFWDRYRENPEATLPNTLNLIGYLETNDRKATAPEGLSNLPEGLHRTKHNDQNPIVYVSNFQNQTLYLVFNEKQVSRLSFFFGIVPLAFVLLVLYVLAYLSYALAKRALSPIAQVASRMEAIDINLHEDEEVDFDDLKRKADTETHILIESIESFLNRLSQFISRERNFTRYASHELRTPLSVIKGSVDNLKNLPHEANQDRHLNRIQKTVCDMEILLETLLLLAREESGSRQQEAIIFNDLAALTLEQYEFQNNNPDIKIKLQQNALLNLRCPAKLLNSLLSNLLNNAINHTQKGDIVVTVEKDNFSVADTGQGIEEQNLKRIFDPFFREAKDTEKGFGLGLSIVKKICNQYGWGIEVSSEPMKGTTFTITTSNSEPI